MRKIHKLALPILVVAAVVALNAPAHAGEPFHPIWIPDYFFDFFGWF